MALESLKGRKDKYLLAHAMKSITPLLVGILLLGIVLISCESEIEPIDPIPPAIAKVEKVDTKTVVEVEKPAITLPEIKIESFSEFPDEIDGCACYFGKSKEELGDGKYVFITNYENLAFMQLDGKLRTFDLVSASDRIDGELTEIWSNEDYDMTITTSQTGQIDETSQNVGTITIKSTTQKSSTISIAGECGC